MFVLILCYAAMISLAVAVNLLPVFLTTLAVEIGPLTQEQLGRIGAVTFIGLVGAIAVAGPLADRWGARVFAIGGNLFIALGLAVLAFAPTYNMVLVSVFLMGVGAGALDMVLSPIVAALQPRHRTVAMNLLHSFYCTGAVLTILAGALALRLGWGWRAVSLYLIAMPALVGLGFLRARIPPLVAEGNDRMPIRQLAGQRYFLLALVAIFLGGSTEMGMAYWLPKYAERDLHFSRWTADMAFLAFSLAMAVGRIIIGIMGHKMDAIRLLLFCCAGAAGLFLCASFAPSHRVALSACVLAGLTGSALWPSVLAIAADGYPHGGASMFALLSAAGNLGGITMPWVVGFIADHSHLSWGLATATLCPALMIPCLLWMRRLRQAATPAPERASRR